MYSERFGVNTGLSSFALGVWKAEKLRELSEWYDNLDEEEYERREEEKRKAKKERKRANISQLGKDNRESK